MGRYGEEIGSDQFGATIMASQDTNNTNGTQDVIIRLSNVEVCLPLFSLFSCDISSCSALQYGSSISSQSFSIELLHEWKHEFVLCQIMFHSLHIQSSHQYPSLEQYRYRKQCHLQYHVGFSLEKKTHCKDHLIGVAPCFWQMEWKLVMHFEATWPCLFEEVPVF